MKTFDILNLFELKITSHSSENRTDKVITLEKDKGQKKTEATNISMIKMAKTDNTKLFLLALKVSTRSPRNHLFLWRHKVFKSAGELW